MTAGGDGYLIRVAGRVKPSGTFGTVEEPRTLVWIGVAWTWGSAVNTTLIAALFFTFGEASAGWISVGLAVLFAGCWFLFAATGSSRATFGVAVLGSVTAVTWIHVLVGGYANTGSFLFWGIGVTVVAALFLRRSEAVVIGLYWIAAAVVLGVLEEQLRASRPAPDPGLAAVLAPYTMVLLIVLLAPVIGFLLGRLASERRRSESLLLNVLPESIARRLKTEESGIADDYQECSVLFADIVGFTDYARTVAPHEVLNQLNSIFSAFDNLASRYEVQKIKTIGDGYMAVAGVPDHRDDHLEAICRLALDMRTAVGDLEGVDGRCFELRIGISTGPVVAGVIGTTRFSFDLWGDTVNMASRMESYAEPGRIQVSGSVRELAAEEFEFVSAGTIDMKGYGPTEAFYLKTLSGEPVAGRG